MSARTLQTALRECRLALDSTGIKSLSQAQRLFSTTPARRKNGAIATFTETSNPDLNELFSRIRSTIFLPSHLRFAQRNLIHRTRHHALLRAEPFVVEVADESVQLQPIDRTKDVPDSWAVTLQALDLMRNAGPAEWTNLVALLAGMRTAGRKWKGWQVEKVVRAAGEAGMAHAVLESVRAAARTGLDMRELRIVREVFWACRSKALLSGWAKEETERALVYAEQLARLLEDEKHWGKVRSARGGDPRIQPDVIAVVLELAAVRAVKYQAGKDKDNEVLAYAQRLMANMNRAVEEAAEEKRVVVHADYELARWVPMLNALKLAQQVLGDSMPEGDSAARKIQELEGKIQRAGQVVVGGQDSNRSKRRGLIWAEELEQSA